MDIYYNFTYVCVGGGGTWWSKVISKNVVTVIKGHFTVTAEVAVKVIRSQFGKSILQVPDTGTRVLDNTRQFLRSSIESFWITPAGSKEHKYHIFRQYWYTKNVPVFTNTGTFQYLGPEVYFFRQFKATSEKKLSQRNCKVLYTNFLRSQL